MSHKLETILFLPINAPGHINPSLALADRLSQQYGYKCVFAMLGKVDGDGIARRGHQLIELEIRGASTSFRESQCWSAIIQTSLANSSPDKVLECMITTLGPHHVTSFIENADQYETIIEKFDPKLVVIDDVFAPPFLVKNEHKYPWVRIQGVNIMSKYISKLPNGLIPVPYLALPLGPKEERMRWRREEPEKFQALIDCWINKWSFFGPLSREMHEPAYDFQLSHGLGHRIQEHFHRDKVPYIDSPYLTIYLLPEVLDYREHDDLFEPPKLYMQCDSLIREAAIGQEEQERWLRLMEQKSIGKKAKVLFSLGSIACDYREIIEGFIKMLGEDQDKLYIVSKGIKNDDIELNESNMLGGTWIPQPFLLKHVDLAIVHGGTGGIAECLYNGVPMIAIPIFGDHFDNTQRLVDKQLGKRLPLQVSAKQLIGAVEELLGDAELRRRVSAVGEKMRARDELSRVTRILHELAQNKCLSDEIYNENNIAR